MCHLFKLLHEAESKNDSPIGEGSSNSPDLLDPLSVSPSHKWRTSIPENETNHFGRFEIVKNYNSCKDF